ncbi:MAG: thioesterase [Ferruginibacter sp.]
MNPGNEKFIRLVQHPVKFRMFLFLKLPSAFFSGVRVKHIDERMVIVTVPYKWFSQNPFRSTYFACLAMAAEMSTGLPGMLFTYNSVPSISMLVLGIEGVYHKKATGLTTFTCQDGDAINDTIRGAVSSGEGRSIRARSVGRNEAGELVVEFFITWSFKSKKP